eukprot:100788-Pleurochrysis_carterae.AAC.1
MQSDSKPIRDRKAAIPSAREIGNRARCEEPGDWSASPWEGYAGLGSDTAGVGRQGKLVSLK